MYTPHLQFALGANLPIYKIVDTGIDKRKRLWVKSNKDRA